MFLSDPLLKIHFVQVAPCVLCRASCRWSSGLAGAQTKARGRDLLTFCITKWGDLGLAREQDTKRQQELETQLEEGDHPTQTVRVGIKSHGVPLFGIPPSRHQPQPFLSYCAVNKWLYEPGIWDSAKGNL